MSMPMISISREFGSGGRDVAIALSEKLGIPFYDREKIMRVAQESGKFDEDFARMEEAVTRPFQIFLNNYSSNNYEIPYYDYVNSVMVKQVQEIAAAGPAIIVGRCADYILEHVPTVNVFVQCGTELRVQRVMERDGISRKEAESKIQKTDRGRSSFYQKITGRPWGARSNYDLVIDSRIGIDQTAEVLALYIRELENV